MYEIWSLGHKPFESYNNPEVYGMMTLEIIETTINIHAWQTYLGDQNVRQGLSPPSPSWTIKRALQDHDSVLVCAKI